MHSYWKNKIKTNTEHLFTGRSDEVGFFSSFLRSADPAYLVIYVHGVGGVGKTTLLDQFDSLAREQGAIVARVNEQQTTIPALLEKLGSDITAQGGNVRSFQEVYAHYEHLTSVISTSPDVAHAMREYSGRYYSQHTSSGGSTSSTRPTYDLNAIRTLLTDALDHQELLVLCWDNPEFRPVYEKASHAMGKHELITSLLDFSERRMLLDILLQHVQRINPAQYENYHTRLAPLTLQPDISHLSTPDNSSWLLASLLPHLVDPRSRELLANPHGVLTRTCLHDIYQEAHHRHIVLMFDTWEFLASFADTWMHTDVLTRNIDCFTPSTTLVLAGRELLSEAWQPVAPITKYINLHPFTPDEAHAFLIKRGITDTTAIQRIQEASGNLPVMLALLSTQSYAGTEESVATQNVIERFLKWIPRYESTRREAIIACALPRWFDENTIAALLPDVDAKELFTWLSSFSFVLSQTGQRHYHPVIRRLMIAYLLDHDTDRYNDLNGMLATYYDDKVRSYTSSSHDTSILPQTLIPTLRLEWLYHKLLQNQGLDTFLNLFLQSFRWSGYARDLVQTFMETQEVLQQRSILYDWYILFSSVPKCREALDYTIPDWLPLFERLMHNETLVDPSLRSFVSYETGYFYVIQKRYVLAEQAYLHALAIDPEYVSAQNSLGYLYEVTGRTEQAEHAYRRCIELEPSYILSYHHLARLLQQLGRDDEAETYLRQAINLRPHMPDTYMKLAFFLYRAGRYQEACTLFEKTLEIEPDNAEAHTRLGNVRDKLNQPDKAEQAYRHALALNPDTPHPWLYLGMLLAQTNRSAEAIESLRRCLAIEPDNTRALIQLAQVLEASGQLDDALEAYRQADQLRPDTPALIYVIGELYQKLERYDDARAWFARYFRLVSQQ